MNIEPLLLLICWIPTLVYSIKIKDPLLFFAIVNLIIETLIISKLENKLEKLKNDSTTSN